MRALAIDQRMARLGFGLRTIPGLEAAWLSRFPYGLGTMRLPADGTPMGTWVDLSGKGRNLTQGTSANQPLWKANGGIPGLQFDGVNDSLQTVPLAGWPETTVYAVASVLGGAGTYRSLLTHRYNISGTIRGVILYTEDVNRFSTWGGSTTSWKISGYPSNSADSARHVWSARLNPSSIKLYVDGNTSTNDPGAGFTPITAADNRSIYLGAGGDLGNQFFMPGIIHDVIICSQAHDDATRKRVEAALARANGVTLAA